MSFRGIKSEVRHNKMQTGKLLVISLLVILVLSTIVIRTESIYGREHRGGGSKGGKHEGGDGDSGDKRPILPNRSLFRTVFGTKYLKKNSVIPRPLALTTGRSSNFSILLKSFNS